MSESISSVLAVTAPLLTGVWVYDPTNPDASERNFLHADGRSESIRPDSSSTRIAGRLNPLIEFGEVTVVGLKLTVFIPFSEDNNATHNASVEWWKAAALNRRTICYRDNRGRLYWVALPEGVEVQDGRVGSAFTLALQRVNYDESVL